MDTRADPGTAAGDQPASVLLVDPTHPAVAEALSGGLDSIGASGPRTWVWCAPRHAAHPPLEGRHLQAADVRIAGVPFAEFWLAAGPDAARWAVSARLLLDSLDRSGGGPAVLLSDRWEPLSSLTDLVIRAAPDGLSLVARASSTLRPAGAAHAGGWERELAVVRPGASGLLSWWEVDAVRRLADRDDRLADPWGDFVATADGLTAMSGAGIVFTPAADRDPVPQESPVLLEVPEVDPDRPWRYAAPGGEPLAIAGCEWLQSAVARRAELLARPQGSGGSGFEVVPGLPASDGLRERYRAARLRGEVGSPFVVGEERSFLDWLRAPDPQGVTGVSRIADIIFEQRADVSSAFPHPRWRDRQEFTRWLSLDGVAQGELPLGLVPALAPPRLVAAPPDAMRFGVNLIGYHGAELGLGVAVRRMGRALDAAGIPWEPVAYDATASRSREVGGTFGAPYHFNLITITAEQLPVFLADVGTGILGGRYTIGQWFWETDVMPEPDLGSFDLVDEVWGATQYLTDVFSALTETPVHHVPVPLEFPGIPNRATARDRFGFDERFTVLFSFDFFSILERKNPLGLIEAYRRAFPEGSATRLILKSINGVAHPDGLAEVECAVSDRDDIELWDRYLDPADRMALVAAADCYVSLHRSEGLGLTMAEAMAAGTPLVASAYSGNLDFMDDTSALLVPGREVLIGEGSYYPATGHWFDPDLDAAADALRRLQAEPELRTRLAATARQRVRAAGTAASAVAVQARLEHLWREARAEAARTA